MKALIIAAGDLSPVEGADERAPAFLLPLIDRPFLQHVVEYVMDAGLVDSIEVVVSHMPERVEALLGDGTRWGVPIRYHLARDRAAPYASLSRFAGDGPILLVHGDCLPDAALNETGSTPGLKAFCREGIWTGWRSRFRDAFRGRRRMGPRQTLGVHPGCRTRRRNHQASANVLGVRTGPSSLPASGWHSTNSSRA